MAIGYRSSAGSGEASKDSYRRQEGGAGELAWTVGGGSLALSSAPSEVFPLNLLLGDLANPT